MAAPYRALEPGAPQGIHARRRLWNRGEERDLSPTQIIDRLVKIPARRMGDAVAAVAIGHEAQVVGKQGGTSVAPGKRNGCSRLPHFTPQGTPRRLLHAR